MGPLDDLYGLQAHQGLARAASGLVAAQATDQGTVRVDIELAAGGQLRGECAATSITWLWLVAARPRRGLYTDLCTHVPEWAKGVGVQQLVAWPDDADAADVLLSRGGWQRRGDGALVWVLT